MQYIALCPADLDETMWYIGSSLSGLYTKLRKSDTAQGLYDHPWIPIHRDDISKETQIDG